MVTVIIGTSEKDKRKKFMANSAKKTIFNHPDYVMYTRLSIPGRNKVGRKFYNYTEWFLLT